MEINYKEYEIQEKEFTNNEGMTIPYKQMIVVMEINGREVEFIPHPDFKGLVKREMNKEPF